MKKIFSLLVFCLSIFAYSVAQDTLKAIVVAPEPPKPKQTFTRATFNATKIINMQSTEIVSKGTMQFMVSHHFSYIFNEGQPGGQSLAQLFGLNSGVAHTYVSFDYSPLDYLNLGVAAAGFSQYEGWAKFKLLRQQTGEKEMPVSMALYSLFNVNTASDPTIEITGNRFSFLNQLLVARKFSDKLSLQFIPTWIHFNVVPYGINNSNDVFSLGMAGKYKMTNTLNLTFEYSRQLNMYENIITKSGTIMNYNPDLLSAGIEINTGGHLFQFYVGNTVSSSNIDQMAKNTSSIKDGNFAFGFTINRSF